jgi:hypothetical protein
MEPLPNEQAIAMELAAIQQRLAAMVLDAREGADVGAELGRIRADLRRLAEENDEIQRRLGPLLGDTS